MIEGQLVKDLESGVWYFEYRDSSLSITDEIEYWMYIEKYGVGYYSTDTISINGNWLMIWFPWKLLFPLL